MRTVVRVRSASSLPFYDESIQLARSMGESRHLAFAIAVKNHQFFHSMTPEGIGELEEAIAISRENGSDTELMWALSANSTAT